MSTPQDILRNMISDVPESVAGIDANLGTIQENIDILDEQIDAMQDVILDPVASDLTDYLNNVKLPQFQLIDPTAYLVFGANYNVTNLTDWAIYVVAPPPIPPAPPAADSVVYEYEGVGWDGDVTITQWVTDWTFTYDYLTHSLGTSGTYGKIPMRSSLNDAKSLLTANKNKLNNSVDVFGRYV